MSKKIILQSFFFIHRTRIHNNVRKIIFNISSILCRRTKFYFDNLFMLFGFVVFTGAVGDGVLVVLRPDNEGVGEDKIVDPPFDENRGLGVGS